VNEINDYKQQGLSITQISALTGHSRPTIRKYLAQTKTPRYGPRQPRPTLLDAHLPFLEARLKAGVWNAVVLLRELKEQGYTGGYTAVKEFVRPKRNEAHTVAVRRFETPPGKQAQVDWADLGDITDPDGAKHKLNGFVMTLGYSRAIFFDIAADQKLPAFLRMHETAFAYLGGVPEEILYDNTKTVVLKTLTEGVDTRGEVKLNPTFADFARYLLDDPHTRVIAGFVEGFKTPAKFVEIAKLAAARGKPIVMIKIGRSPAGAKAATSHTAAMTGTGAIASTTRGTSTIVATPPATWPPASAPCAMTASTPASTARRASATEPT